MPSRSATASSSADRPRLERFLRTAGAAAAAEAAALSESTAMGWGPRTGLPCACEERHRASKVRARLQQHIDVRAGRMRDYCSIIMPDLLALHTSGAELLLCCTGICSAVQLKEQRSMSLADVLLSRSPSGRYDAQLVAPVRCSRDSHSKTPAVANKCTLSGIVLCGLS